MALVYCPAHHLVNWGKTARDGSGRLRVAVRCPECSTDRMELATSVRKRIVAGTFTGRCRRHKLGRRPISPEWPVHPAVDWEKVHRRDGALVVDVTCPNCHQVRNVEAKSVRYQVRNGRFTGLCRADRLLGKKLPTSQERPYHPDIDWDDWEVVVDQAQQRRRSMTRVRCADCSEVTLYNTAYLIRLVKGQRFTPGCKAHRAVGRPVAAEVTFDEVKAQPVRNLAVTHP